MSLSYEENLRPCPACRRETWHARRALDVLRPRSLTAISHLIMTYNNLFIPWRCLDCGRKARGKPLSKPPAIRTE